MDLIKLKKNINSQIVGSELHYFQELSSTNTYLYQMDSKKNLKDGTVVISDSQTEGKGRLKRKWVSPKGKNLYMSILFKPKLDSATASIFTFLASCALKDTIDGYGLSSTIKWPNDILIDRKKISGVLAELRYTEKSVDSIIIGIGVNLNMSKKFMLKVMPDIKDKVTSLSDQLGKRVDREKFSADLINNIDRFYIKFLQLGKDAILSEWNQRWEARGTEIEVRDGKKIYKGIAESVDENGFLHLRKPDGKIEKVITGDVIF